MLWLACWHHIQEKVLEAVVLFFLSPSKSPDIMIFTRFQTNWEFIDRANYQIVVPDATLHDAISCVADEIIVFA